MPGLTDLAMGREAERDQKLRSANVGPLTRMTLPSPNLMESASRPNHALHVTAERF